MTKFLSIFTFLFLFVSMIGFSQKNSLNNYKYVIVPVQFEFQNNEDDYQVNSLTKFLFERAGYTTFLSNESYPQDLASNACLAVKAIVVNNSGMFATKMHIKVVDCFNNVLFLTDETSSREKEYKKSYHEAIRSAFEEIEALEYKYTPVNEKSVADVQTEKKVEEKPIVKEVVDKIDDIQVKSKEVVAVVEEKKPEQVIEKKVIKSKPIQEEIKEIEIKPTAFSIEGKYNIEKWGICTLSATEEGYSLKGGDENFEFAVLYKTSKPSIFIIKYAAFKQPQLAELDSNGNLNIDSSTTTKTYKRIP